MKQIHARVIDLWVDQGQSHIEAVAGDVRFVYEVPESLATSIGKGDWVSLTLDPSGKVSSWNRQGGPVSGGWSQSGDALRWRRVSSVGQGPRGGSRMSRLWQRQQILGAIRQDLVEQGFLEIESPLMVKGSCPDVEIESVGVSGGYLVNSTEYQIKRMMVGGFEKLFTLTKNFRGGDEGRLHSSEFTMLEWARTFSDLNAIEEDAVRFVRRALSAIAPGSKEVRVEGHLVNLMDLPWERLSVREAFERHLGMTSLMDFSLKALTESASRASVQLPTQFKDDRDLILSFLMDKLQPFLGHPQPTFLTQWPSFMTTSADIDSDDPMMAHRSELFIGGIEISDGFPFLRDPKLQRTFFDRELNRRKEQGVRAIALDQAFLKSLDEGLPPGAGMALGVDRLVMVLLGAERISDVQAFTWDEV